MKFLLVIILLVGHLNFSQAKKTVIAYKFDEAPRIDGLIDGEVWSPVPKASDFTLFRPNTSAGKKIPQDFSTTVQIGYDNKAIYVAAQLNHPNPNKIPNEYGARDQVWNINAEVFWISLNTYNDNLNSFGFMVSSSGNIGDSFSSGEFNDESLRYDTVFDAKVSMNSDGWSVEMIIPYSAIRFLEKEKQDWGINFGRNIKELDEAYVWSPVDEKVLKYHETLGLLKSLNNIKPPTRLFLYPYLQSSINLQKNTKPSHGYSAGLDLKYGINNSFTLDATLIPDFGQVSFDNKELNLTPFEQQYSEKRAFFTEGASIFKKADGGWGGGRFFYSRRIGQELSYNNDSELSNEELLRYDDKPDLINSIKITGTTENKLSLGVLNAFTEKTYAYFENKENGEIRKEEVSPITNFNVIALNKLILNDYSSFSLLNSNVIRGKNYHNANNTAFVLDLFDNKKKYNLQLKNYYSVAPRFSEKNGFRGSFSLSEVQGNIRFGLYWNGVDRNYNQNELGFYNTYDNQSIRGRISYQIFNETKLLRTYSNYLSFGNSYTYHSFDKKRSGWRFGNNFTTKNLMSFELDFDYTSRSRDYDETRVSDRFIIEPSTFEIKFGMNSNQNKAFSYGLDYRKLFFKNRQHNEKKDREKINSYIKYRFSNSLSLTYRYENEMIQDDVGFLEISNDNIYFGKRNINSIENSINLKYSFNSSKSLNLRFRNFWSTAKYENVLYNLQTNGLRNIVNYDELSYDPNTNFNIWNLDVNFEWWFAAGSNLIFLYRNQIFNQDNRSGINYYNSLKNLFQKPIEHQFTLRINYLIDFNNFRKK